MPRPCASIKPSHACSRYPTASAMGSAARCSSNAAMSPPRSFSITMYGAPFSRRATSNTRTTCTLCIRATARASNSRRDTTASLAAKSSRTTLIATGASNSKCVALSTIPMPPAPRKPSIRYFPSTIAPGSSAGRSEGCCGAGEGGILLMVRGTRCCPSKQERCLSVAGLATTTSRADYGEMPHLVAASGEVSVRLKSRPRQIQVRAVGELQGRRAAFHALVERAVGGLRGHARADDTAALDRHANLERRVLGDRAAAEPCTVFEDCGDCLRGQISAAVATREVDILARRGERGFTGGEATCDGRECRSGSRSERGGVRARVGSSV